MKEFKPIEALFDKYYNDGYGLYIIIGLIILFIVIMFKRF